MNLDVAPEYIIDTVEIFHIESATPPRPADRRGQRKIALKYLARVVLDIDMQSRFGHDSIEDARTALLVGGTVWC